MSTSRKEFLKRLLVPYWLRPESALWYAHEAFLTQSYVGAQLKSPSLELGCMEGTSSFVMLGGQFGAAFDVYGEVSWSRDSLRWKSHEQDYYNTVGTEKTEALDIKVQPSAKFDVGVAWKKAHAVKAGRLGIYNKLVEQESSAPLAMLAPGQFETVWAPNFYWIDRLEPLLGEVRRVLRPNGRLITVLPDSAALTHMIYQSKGRADKDWISDLDRGRYANIARQARTLTEWTKFFEQNKFRITRQERYLPALVLKVNDIGLRPLFPVLMDIYETLRQKCPEDFERIKQSWIDTAYHFLAPMCETEWMNPGEAGQVWHIFELTAGKN